MAKWSRERIIREILRREASGLSLDLGGAEPVHSTLYQAASRVFGSWRNAVMAAGISPENARVRDPWSPARILASIKSLARRKQPLPPAELKRRYHPLVEAARRHFGSWPKAVIAAGVEPEKLKRVMPWTRERITEAILTRVLNCEPLGSRTVKPRSLAEAGARVFGSWPAALAAAGVDPEQASRRHGGVGSASDEGSATHQGKTAARAQVRRRRNPGTRWSEEEILQAIAARLREKKRMNAAAVDDDDGPLYRVAKRRYGSWRSALLAAGLNPDEVCARPATSPVPTSRPLRRHL